jgi:hypothetical protein
MGLGMSVAAAQSQQIAPSHLAAAREVVIGSGIVRTFDNFVPQFGAQIMQTIGATRPGLVKQLEDTIVALKPEFDAQKEEIISQTARLFALKMSELELKDVSVFFKSPSGQRYVEAQPEILDDIFQATQDWSQKLSEFMMTRVRQEMAKKGHNL